MKKGQKVRVLADDRVGIVADSHFFNWGGKRMVQHQVKFPDTKGEAPWFPSDKLGSIMEKCQMTITGEQNRIIELDIELNHETKNAEIKVTADFTNKKSLPMEMLRYFLVGSKRCANAIEISANNEKM